MRLNPPAASLGFVTPPIWKETFKIHSYEVDFKRTATLEMICRYFQEAAWNHAEALGVGFEQLAAQQQLWVLSRLFISVYRYPLWRETIDVQTWPRAIEGPFAMRDFEIFDSSQDRIVAGTSGWLVLALASRRPQRVDKLLSHIPDASSRRATGRSPEKLPEERGNEGQNQTDRREIHVHHSDLDVNDHVNNSRYLGWLLDSYTAEFHRQNQVSSCEVNYSAETTRGHKLLIESHSTGDGIYTHRISNQAGAVACRARLAWQPVRAAHSDP